MIQDLSLKYANDILNFDPSRFFWQSDNFREISIYKIVYHFPPSLWENVKVPTAWISMSEATTGTEKDCRHSPDLSVGTGVFFSTHPPSKSHFQFSKQNIRKC
jgi:hypothetical protein